MSSQFSEEEIRKIARERVMARKGFYSHLAVYVLVNIMLIAIWWFNDSSRGYFWPMWVLLGWGIGVIFNAIAVFRRHDVIKEHREIEQEIEKIKSGR